MIVEQSIALHEQEVKCIILIGVAQQLHGSHVTLSQTRLLTLDVNSIYMRELETVKII